MEKAERELLHRELEGLGVCAKYARYINKAFPYTLSKFLFLLITRQSKISFKLKRGSGVVADTEPTISVRVLS